MNILVAVGEAAADDYEPPIGVTLLLDAADQIFVMSPSLPRRLDFLTSNIDRAQHAADERLGVVLNQLKSRGIAATGITGDESPMTAFADAIDQFDPDHILIALRSSEHRGWQEHRLIDHIVERFRIPVTVFTMEP